MQRRWSSGTFCAHWNFLLFPDERYSELEFCPNSSSPTVIWTVVGWSLEKLLPTIITVSRQIEQLHMFSSCWSRTCHRMLVIPEFFYWVIVVSCEVVDINHLLKQGLYMIYRIHVYSRIVKASPPVNLSW